MYLRALESWRLSQLSLAYRTTRNKITREITKNENRWAEYVRSSIVGKDITNSYFLSCEKRAFVAVNAQAWVRRNYLGAFDSVFGSFYLVNYYMDERP